MNWKLILLPATAIPVIALLGYGLTRDPNVIETPLEGREASDFTAPTLAGDTLRGSDFKGRVLVLNFWASWCIPCLEEHPHLLEADRRYDDEDVQIVGVLYQDSEANARRWLSEWGGEWPTVLDRNSRVAIDYGVYGVPETYIVGRDGRIAHKQIGPLTRDVLFGWIERLREAPETEAL